MNRIKVYFEPCTPTPPQGYSVLYRVKGTMDTFTNAGNFYASPAVFFDTANPSGTLYEGFIGSIFPGLACNQIPWESTASSSGGESSGGGDPICRAYTITNESFGTNDLEYTNCEGQNVYLPNSVPNGATIELCAIEGTVNSTGSIVTLGDECIG